MVSGSSVNPLHFGFPPSANPYERETTVATAATAVPGRSSAHECSAVPLFPHPLNTTVPSSQPAIPYGSTLSLDRAVSPSRSTDSAAAGAGTPLVDRHALGHFSASTPQFGVHGMSPAARLVESPVSRGTIHGPQLGLTAPSHTVVPDDEQLMVVVHPDGDDDPRDPVSSASTEAGAANAAAAAHHFSSVDPAAAVESSAAPAPPAGPHLGKEPEPLPAGNAGPGPSPPPLMLPPLPPLAPPPHPPPSPQHLPAVFASPTRPRLGSVTLGHGVSATGMSPTPSDGPSAGMSPAGSLSDHITRTASLPLLMGGTVIPQGVSAAIPIAIAGVGASGRVRATTIHAPLGSTGSVGLGIVPNAGGGAAFSTGSVGAAAAGSTAAAGGSAAGALRTAAQSVDHHFIQQHMAAQQHHQHHHHHQQQQQHSQFFHQSDGGAPASSPAQFVGSLSPSGPGFLSSILSGPPIGPAAPPAHPGQSPARPDVDAGGGGGSGTPMSCRSHRAAPAARFLQFSGGEREGAAGGPPTQLQGLSPERGLPPEAGGLSRLRRGSDAADRDRDRHDARDLELAAALAATVAAAGASTLEEEGGYDPMSADRVSSVTSSSLVQQHLVMAIQQEPTLPSALLDLQPQAQGQGQGQGQAAQMAAGPCGGEEEGDEEFVDAVEVQHDDEDHVARRGRSPGGPTRSETSSQGAAGGASPQSHSHLQLEQLAQQAQAQARSQPELLAAVQPPQHQREQFVYPPDGAAGLLPERRSGEAAAPAPVDLPGGGAAGAHASCSQQQQQQQQASGAVAGPGAGSEVVLPNGGSAGMYRPVTGFVEGDDEDEELVGTGEEPDLEEDGLGQEQEDLRLDEGDEEEEVEEEEEEDDEDIGGGAAAWGMAMYTDDRHTCVNCTRPFWGSACRYCGHPAHVEVVRLELLDAVVRSMLAGDAATRQRDQQRQAEAAQAQAQGRLVQGEARGAEGGVVLAYDDRCRAHLEERKPGCAADMGRSHPERPERVAAIMTRLKAAGLLERFERITGREATTQELVAVHEPELVVELQAATETAARLALREQQGGRCGGGAGDMEVGDDTMMAVDGFSGKSAHILDCYFNASTAACARLAAGSAAEVAQRVVAGSARHGAAIIRPPGHHAESGTAMGFCYFNNAAVAARAAQAAGARRVVIMDWDVHHGNGTQRIFYEDPSVLYMSTHRFDNGHFYPGSGDATETGSGAGLGFTVNVPWNGAGVRDSDMLAAFRHVVVPIAAEFRPDLVIVSAGYDAVDGDPLGGCRLSPAVYSHFTAQLAALAPTVLLLEGGYNLTATAAATEACMRVLLGDGTTPLPSPVHPAALGPLTAAGAGREYHPHHPHRDPWVTSGLEGVSDSALDSLRVSLRVQSQYWLVAREQYALVEMAVQKRQQQLLLRLQQPPLQPREQWGWHVQVPAQRVPGQAQVDGHGHCQPDDDDEEEDGEEAMVEAMVDVRQVLMAQPALHPGVGLAGGLEHMEGQEGAALAGEEEEEVEDEEGVLVAAHRRRMDASTSGVMDLGEPIVDPGLAVDIHMNC